MPNIGSARGNPNSGEPLEVAKEVACVFLSGTLAPQLLFNLSVNANDSEVLVVDHEVLNENSIALLNGAVTIAATTALSASATRLSIAGDTGN